LADPGAAGRTARARGSAPTRRSAATAANHDARARGARRAADERAPAAVIGRWSVRVAAATPRGDRRGEYFPGYPLRRSAVVEHHVPAVIRGAAHGSSKSSVPPLRTVPGRSRGGG